MNKVFMFGVAGLLGSAAQAGPVLVYQNDFANSQKVGPEWVSRPDWNTAAHFGGFIGRFGQETHVLQLNAFRPDKNGDGSGDGGHDDGGNDDGGGSGGGPGGGGSGGGGQGGGRTAVNYTLVFDLYLLDSWDGPFAGPNGPDYFGVAANGQTLLWEGWHSTKPERNIVRPDVGPTNLGFNSNYADSIFRNIALQFSAAPDIETLRISFIGAPSSVSLDDESWGIDNVRLYAQSVPAPSGAALAAVGLGFVSSRRRRG